MENSNENTNNKKRKAAKCILIIIAIIMIIFGAVSFGVYLYDQYNADQQEEQLSSVAETTVKTENTVDNPIDFDSLTEKNDEIYAWIKVPGTKVDYPVVQSSVDDDFYLKHSAMDKKWLASGAIYTQSMNSKLFNDRVTVIYGHNGYKETMFTSLHSFAQKNFFDKHEYFYIYTPDSKLTYRIISAFKYDDRHILNTFDFQDDSVFEKFIQMLQNPDSNNKNVRQNLDKEITKNDNIAILSTCITNQKSSRYLVCGVLIKNEKTN